MVGNKQKHRKDNYSTKMNSFGNIFRLTTFGESHGPAVGGVIDGCPSGLSVDFNLVETELARRRGDGLENTTQRKESDVVEWLSGIMDGITIGTPIAFIIRNRDVQSADYEWNRDLYRPGHGDYTWESKYGIRDYRGGGRCSARETAVRVVAGAIAKQLLHNKGITIASQISQPTTPSANDTVGGLVECTVTGLPVGLGEPLFGKLQSQLAAAMMSIPSATGFETGEGFRAAQMSGSEYIDQWNSDFSTKTNHCGGLQGGLSNGMPLRFRVAFHPVVTLPNDLPCIDKEGNTHIMNTVPGRHDRNHTPRAAVIVEAMTAIVLTDAMLTATTNNIK